MTCAGLVLAAGAGRRMGGPKALLLDADGTPWVARAAGVLLAGGCAPVVAVLGAAADRVAPLVPAGVRTVVAPDWAEGMGASLRAGLAALSALPEPDAVVVALVDMPGVTSAAVARLVALAAPSVLARAAYDGVPGHPVLLGRRSWDDVRASARGDAGGRAYLRGREVRLVECGDVGSGEDLDEPPTAGARLQWEA